MTEAINEAIPPWRPLLRAATERPSRCMAARSRGLQGGMAPMMDSVMAPEIPSVMEG